MNEKLSMSQLNRINPDEFRQSAKVPVILILENIRSGLNVGSIFRSADAFRIERIVCAGITPVPPHREVLKSALGATETVNWQFCTSALDAIADLKAKGIKCLALEQVRNSVSLSDLELKMGESVALVLGNEVSGVSQEAIDACEGTVEIAQYGTKHSLNVAVCAGIALFSISERLLSQKK